MIRNMNLKKVIERLRKNKKSAQGLNICFKRKNMRIRLRIGDILRKIIRQIQWGWVHWISMRINRSRACIRKTLSQRIFIKKWIMILAKIVLNKLKFWMRKVKMKLLKGLMDLLALRRKMISWQKGHRD